MHVDLGVKAEVQSFSRLPGIFIFCISEPRLTPPRSRTIELSNIVVGDLPTDRPDEIWRDLTSLPGIPVKLDGSTMMTCSG